MKTKHILLLLRVAALGLMMAVTSAAASASPTMTRSTAMTRPAARFTPTAMAGRHRLRRFHNRTFIFVDAFGFPGLYPYPYSYYPYAYHADSDYQYRGASLVAEVQRRLASAGYYHGPIDGILGPQTRRAIRAYQRDHNVPAYGVIDRQLVRTFGLG